MQLYPDRPALTLNPLSPVPSLEEVTTDLNALWQVVVKLKKAGSPVGVELEAQTRSLFVKHNAARTDLGEALTLRRAVRALLNCPDDEPETPLAVDSAVLDTPTVNERSGAAFEEESAPDDGPADEAESATEEESALEDEAESAADDESAPEDEAAVEGEAVPEADLPSEVLEAQAPVQDAPLVLPPAVVTWDEQLLGRGLISGLAQTLALGNMVQLVVVRTAEDELLVTVQPGKLDGESDALCRALNVRGTPAELDAGLLSEMNIYKRVRQTVREVANTLLEDTLKTAAAAANAKAKEVKAREDKAAAAKAKAGESKTGESAEKTKAKDARATAFYDNKAKRTQEKTAAAERSAAPESVPEPAPITTGSLKLSMTNPELSAEQVRVQLKIGDAERSGTLATLNSITEPPTKVEIKLTCEGYAPYYTFRTLKLGVDDELHFTLAVQPNLIN